MPRTFLKLKYHTRISSTKIAQADIYLQIQNLVNSDGKHLFHEKMYLFVAKVIQFRVSYLVVVLIFQKLFWS